MIARRAARLAVLLAAVLGCGAAQAQASAKAIFASGCFWCTESDFEKLDGVISAVSGYTGGTTENPTYEQVGGGQTGHVEAVEVVFDPARISYAELLDHFWRTHDPFNSTGQFCDRGSPYRPAVFVLDPGQKMLAEASRTKFQAHFDQPLLTPVRPATRFWPAEAYHQDYYKTNPLRYRYYRSGCGRDARVAEIWKQAKP